MQKSELIRKIQALREGIDELSFMIAVLPVEPVATQLIESESDDEYLSPKEVQKFLKIKESTFYDWVRTGRLPEGKYFSPKTRRWLKSQIIQAKD